MASAEENIPPTSRRRPGAETVVRQEVEAVTAARCRQHRRNQYAGNMLRYSQTTGQPPVRNKPSATATSCCRTCLSREPYFEEAPEFTPIEEEDKRDAQQEEQPGSARAQHAAG